MFRPPSRNRCDPNPRSGGRVAGRGGEAQLPGFSLDASGRLGKMISPSVRIRPHVRARTGKRGHVTNGNGEGPPMTPRLRTSLAALATNFPRLAGVAVAVTGGLVLAGWAFDRPALRSVVPGLAEVPFPVALFFVLAGLALALLSRAGP